MLAQVKMPLKYINEVQRTSKKGNNYKQIILGDPVAYQQFVFFKRDELILNNIQPGDDVNEFSSQAWNKFPEGLLREITQQRKQKVKVVATSQVFTRVAKQLREQTFEVVECKTLAGRWTWLKAHDAEEYNHVIENPDKKLDLKRLWRKNFIQDKHLRTLYDSYQKIEKMRNTDYIPIQDRLSSKDSLSIRMKRFQNL